MLQYKHYHQIVLYTDISYDFEVGKIETSSKYRKVGIMTLGCKVNQYESTAIAEEFEKHGFEIGRFSEKCGIYVINTCTVTAESDRKTRQMIRRAARHNPEAFILVTGCYSQLNPGKTAGIDGVDFICGNSNKLRLVDAALALVDSAEKNGAADIKVDDIRSAAFEPMMIHSSDHTRAFIKIEDGCDNRCSYCIIPEARGHVRSKLPADVIAEVKGLAAVGYREVVLTGVETAAYGRDFEDGYGLMNLLEDIDRIEGVERIRLGSMNPALMKPDFVERAAKLTHLAPHFHIALQSGSSRTLAGMRRRYNAQTAEKVIADLREHIPGVTFAADVIVGFPDETEEDFLETVDFIRRNRFTHLHIFTYSRRPGTSAAEMENQIPEEVKIERSARLSGAQRETALSIAEGYVGTQREVLFELCEDGRATGHTAEFLEVAVITGENLQGQVRFVKLNGFDGEVYTGFIV